MSTRLLCGYKRTKLERASTNSLRELWINSSIWILMCLEMDDSLNHFIHGNWDALTIDNAYYVNLIRWTSYCDSWDLEITTRYAKRPLALISLIDGYLGHLRLFPFNFLWRRVGFFASSISLASLSQSSLDMDKGTWWQQRGQWLQHLH